jgi:hypothetical protein
MTVGGSIYVGRRRKESEIKGRKRDKRRRDGYVVIAYVDREGAGEKERKTRTHSR